jgi:hypothetical protein
MYNVAATVGLARFAMCGILWAKTVKPKRFKLVIYYVVENIRSVV